MRCELSAAVRWLLCGDRVAATNYMALGRLGRVDHLRLLKLTHGHAHSVRGGLLHMVNDQEFYRPLSRHEFQPELFLYRGKDRGTDWC